MEPSKRAVNAIPVLLSKRTCACEEGRTGKVASKKMPKTRERKRERDAKEREIDHKNRRTDLISVEIVTAGLAG